MSSIPEQLKNAYESKDWAGVVEVLKVFGVDVSEETVVETKPAPKAKKERKTPTTKKKIVNEIIVPKKVERTPKIDHQQWHREHLGSSINIKDRPNKFDVSSFQDKKPYTVPNDKKFGEYAGKTFASEEEYLRIAVYPSARPHSPPPAKKVTVNCATCGRKFKIFESELSVYNEETAYKCDTCLTGNRRKSVSSDDEE